jgi:protein-L-isoaspartate(D-aspartate) O-methyltransferase
MSLQKQREAMVAGQLVARGIHDDAVLDAMRTVPREAFLPEDMVEFAYRDSPLPIAEGQTISQPYIVALMAETLQLEPSDRVLEIGTGSGYAAAILSRIASDVYTIERHAALAEGARTVLEELDYDNVHVRHADGTRGWPEGAPYDAIVVAAGGPRVPHTLRDQLAIGGRLVMPVGSVPRLQELVRVTRTSESEYRRERLGGVQFVPLIGAEGWSEREGGVLLSGGGRRETQAPAELIREVAEPFPDIEAVELGPLLDRIGKAQVVLLGEATHGTSEFYQMRARITRELVERFGFTIVAVEADWPDAARVDHYIRGTPISSGAEKAFTRFPVWMWRNQEVHDFVEWLRDHNEHIVEPESRVGFYGLDLYSLTSSIHAVLRYLELVDPVAARIARERYGCLSPWQTDPATYGRAVLTGRFRACEDEVVGMLRDLLARHLEYTSADGDRFLDAIQNARLVASAEQYYRIMYYGSVESWNLRDRHMFDTLKLILGFRGPDARAVVWEHNSHVGNAAATEMGARGEFNVGQLCRENFGLDAFLVGFGTDHGRVAAASDWDGPMEIKEVRPAHAESYERLCHDSGVEAFLLHLREPARDEVLDELLPPRLERAIGVIYRPETELASHYFQAVLPRQFDEYVWFDETGAVRSPGAPTAVGVPETYPFGV